MRDVNQLYRALPSVDELLRSDELRDANPALAREAARAVLARLREQIRSGAMNGDLSAAVEALPLHVAESIAGSQRSTLRTVINATGVILHTNLGRAPLSEAALQAVAATAGGYTNLEYDIESGARGKRDVHAQQLFARVFAQAGETATIVVNNCAAATMLALNSLAQGGEVIVSRGELVEIGGSFRIPEVMEKSGAILREVGTTNRTRVGDYESAITPNTKLLMRVSRSNFAITGFTEQPAIEELVELGRKHGIPVFEDHGNGSLVNLRDFGVNDPSVHTVQESLHAGAHAIAYSGDKLLGGPQAGMLTGRVELVQMMRSNPLFRALRVDKLTYAALGATLQAYLQQDYDAIPALRTLSTSVDDIRSRAQTLANHITGAEVIEGESTIGGGTAPTSVLPTFLLAITHPHLSADELESKLRTGSPSVIARIQEDRVVLDLRTVFPEQDELLATAVRLVTGNS